MALRRIRLCSGSNGLVRRAEPSRVSANRSSSGSWPRSESLKPPLPYLLPWQVPALQPALEITGSTSLRKEIAVPDALLPAKSSPVAIRQIEIGHVRVTKIQTGQRRG